MVSTTLFGMPGDVWEYMFFLVPDLTLGDFLSLALTSKTMLRAVQKTMRWENVGQQLLRFTTVQLPTRTSRNKMWHTLMSMGGNSKRGLCGACLQPKGFKRMVPRSWLKHYGTGHDRCMDCFIFLYATRRNTHASGIFQQQMTWMTDGCYLPLPQKALYESVLVFLRREVLAYYEKLVLFILGKLKYDMSAGATLRLVPKAVSMIRDTRAGGMSFGQMTTVIRWSIPADYCEIGSMAEDERVLGDEN